MLTRMGVSYISWLRARLPLKATNAMLRVSFQLQTAQRRDIPSLGLYRGVIALGLLVVPGDGRC